MFTGTSGSVSANDTIQGIKAITITRGIAFKADNGNSCLSMSPGDVIGIPVSSDTESFDVTITLVNSNKERYITIGDSTTKKVYHSSSNTNKTDDDGVFSAFKPNITYTGTGFTRADYVDSDDYIRINTGATAEVNSGETKIGSITLTEYKTAASGDAVCAELKSGGTVIATITGAYDSSKGFNAMSAGNDAIELDAEPQAGNFSITAASGNVYILTPEVMLATGCQTIEELTVYLRAFLTGGEHAQEGIFSGIEPDNTLVFDILVKISFDGGHTWVEADESNFPPNGLDVVIPYPEGTDMYNYEFSVGHMFTKNWNGKAPGTMEYIVPEKTMLGIKVHITGASPFVIGWKLITEEENVADTSVSGGSAATGDKVGRLLPLLVYLMLLALVGAAGYMYKTRTASRSRQQ